MREGPEPPPSPEPRSPATHLPRGRRPRTPRNDLVGLAAACAWPGHAALAWLACAAAMPDAAWGRRLLGGVGRILAQGRAGSPVWIRAWLRLNPCATAGSFRGISSPGRAPGSGIPRLPLGAGDACLSCPGSRPADPAEGGPGRNADQKRGGPSLHTSLPFPPSRGGRRVAAQSLWGSALIPALVGAGRS